MPGPDDPFESTALDGARSVSIELVMGAWEATVEREAPWSAMPLDDRTGELRRVIAELLDLSGGLECPARRLRICTVASEHGAFRRRQRCPELIVASDLFILREALKHVLRCGGASHLTTRDVVRPLLPDWRAARRAACAGHADGAAAPGPSF